MYFNSIPLLSKTGAGSFVVALSIALAAMSGQAQTKDGVRIPANLCSWEIMGWRDLNGAERLAWSGLGWTMHNWHHSRSDNYPASYRKSWPELSDTEKLLAGKLGFDSETWDTDECPNYSARGQVKQDTSEQVGTDSSAD